MFFLYFSLKKILGFIFPSIVQAQTKDWVDLQQGGYCVAGPDNDIATIHGIVCLIANILSVILQVLGLAGFIMMIVGALKYMILGNAEGAKSAKNTMTYAVVGLVVALGSYAIMRLIAEFTGVDILLDFTLPSSLTQH